MSLALNADYGDPSLLPHNTAGPQANAVAWSLLAISAAFLAFRVFCKHVGQRGGLWWDDWILVASWVCTESRPSKWARSTSLIGLVQQVIHLVACILLSVMVSMGYGRHPWDVEHQVDNVVTMVRTTLTVTAAAWSKTAFGITILRLGEGQMKWILWFIIVSLNIVSAIHAMFPWVNCQPLPKSWYSSLDGSCMSASIIRDLGYASGG